MLKKILIANRGEIAVRIIRACREMGIPTVAVYSTVDRAALHTQMADEAVGIGPPPPLESYLKFDAIIAAAKKTNADAIHPGYGFLAENHNFAERCETEGIIFIGPDSRALKLVGDKLAARETMRLAGIPIIPGMMVRSAGLSDFIAQGEKIGYPVLLKASAGGGGKGMRVVTNPQELQEAVDAGMREAKSAFGDDTVYLEKYLEEPRHVEFQILGDRFGAAIHLCERECSIQRRHQKIIEETPSMALDESLRKMMGETAVKVAEAAGYSNAGTVEFLLDKNKNFYFLEVNARIQVEHPITEMVTGVDLVKQQIRIAAGEPLALKQEDIKPRGHAIECRVYAEDPENNFLPSPGKILFVREPAGPGIRVDSALYSGMEVTPYYDPILSKVVVWAENREAARRKMVVALKDYTVLGIKTALGFLRAVLEHPQYIEARLSTGFIPRYFPDWKQTAGENLDAALVAVALDAVAFDAGALDMSGYESSGKKISPQRESTTPWNTIGAWRIGGGYGV
jgi:acetyl-CoA carboxylase biotin carboxylase subunit